MAIFGNFKGTTYPSFKVAKSGSAIHGGTNSPTENLAEGDLWFDKSNTTVRVYSSGTWRNVGSQTYTSNTEPTGAIINDLWFVPANTTLKIYQESGWVDTAPVGYTGSRGDATVVGSYVHDQDSASTTWTVNHGLGEQYLNVEVIDSNGKSLTGTYDYPEITFTSSTSLTATFSSARTGKIVLSGGSGYTGSAGADGATGFTGSQGTVGYTGSQGLTGFTGYTGSQGAIGYSGSLGFTGSQGVIGFTGSTGSIGYTGSRGNTGFTGSQGAGFTGSQGASGFTGSQGEQGIQGFTGSAGSDNATLDSVTTNGSVTTNNITVGNVTIQPEGRGLKLSTSSSVTNILRSSDTYGTNSLEIETPNGTTIAIDSNLNGVGAFNVHNVNRGETDLSVDSSGDLVLGHDLILDTNAKYVYAKDASSTSTRILGINASNTTYIGPIDSYAGGSIIYGASTDVSGHAFNVGGNTAITIDTTGFIGVNDPSPTKQLSVASELANTTTPATSTSGVMTLINTSSDSDTYSGIVFQAHDDSGIGRHGAWIGMKKEGSWPTGVDYSGGLSIWTRNGTSNEAEAVYIDPSGRSNFRSAIAEQQYSLTGTVIDPINGTIQYKTLTANTTFTESLNDGDAVTLMIDDGTGFTVTWPTISWVGGSAPTLETTGYNIIELFRVNGTVYGAYVGSA